MRIPGNETKEHFLLKEISKYLLFRAGYTIVGTEVGGMWTINGKRDKKGCIKNVIDAVGIKRISTFIPNSGYQYKHRYAMCGFEAKANLQDFRNGYCTAPAVMYIIAPAGVVPLAEMEKHIGLIEVDFDRLSVEYRSSKITDIKGVWTTKKAIRNIDKDRFSTEESYSQWVENMMDSVAYRTITEMLFWRDVEEIRLVQRQ